MIGHLSKRALLLLAANTIAPAATFWQHPQQPPKTAPISPPGLSFIYFVTCSHKTALVSIFKQSSRQTSNFTIYNLPIQLPYILMKDFGCNDSNRLKLSEDREFSNCIMSFFMLRTKLNANIECWEIWKEMHEKVQFLCSNYQMQKNIIITTFMLFISRISGPVTSEIYLDIIENIFWQKADLDQSSGPG